MSEKIINISDHISKKDLDIILEVNRNAITIETEVMEQNEEIIASLDEIKKSLDDFDSEIESNEEKLDKIIEQNEKLSKELFKIQVLFIGGILGLLVQIIQIFVKN